MLRLIVKLFKRRKPPKTKREPSAVFALPHAWPGWILIFLLVLLLSNCAGPNAAISENRIAAAGTEKIALFPFDNLSKNRDALTRLMPLLQKNLEEKGLQVLGEDALRDFLNKGRIRDRGSVSRDIAMSLEREFGVQAIVTGCVVSYSTDDNPKFGLTARLIDASSGRILWADYASATGDDFIRLLGLGRINTVEDLIPAILDNLLESFGNAPSLRETEQTYRIAVLPFKNRSKNRKAGVITASLFLEELVNHPLFIPVEYGDVRKFMVENQIRNRGELDYRSIEEAFKTLGTELILLGTVESFSEDDNVKVPDVVLDARIVNSRNKKILWYDNIHVTGDDDITIFERGKMRSADKTAHSAVAKLIKNMEKTAWH